MFTEKSKLVEKRENPFYGSYKENIVLEEIHWQNKRKRQQLAMVSAVVLILVILSIGITLAITLPPLLDSLPSLNPPDPPQFLPLSPSILGKYERAGISSESSICSDLGKTILQEKNGSAVDAAVTVTLCHGVTNPQSSGIGGGLFMVIYTRDDGISGVNGREMAPLASTPEIYENNGDAAVKGGLSVGVPGELGALWDAHQKFGKVAWSELLRPVRELAETGFTVTIQLARSLKEHEKKIKGDSALSSEFINPETNAVWNEGEVVKRPRLALTLQQLETNGAMAFYNGSLAADIVSEIKEAGGLITAEDLASYATEWDTPIEYELTGNLTLYTTDFPSSGPVVALALGVLHGFGRKVFAELHPKDRGLDEHRVAEVLKFAHAHRSLIADPDYTDVSQTLSRMLSTSYADELRLKIDDYKTHDNPQHYGGIYSSPKDAGTSHISIIGPDGDAVSLSTSINNGFGAGFMGGKSGIIYNNIMNDFSVANETDVYGTSSNRFNEVEPGKRPGSSMAPLILVNDEGLPVLSTGASGGETILTGVISSTWRALYRYVDIKEAIDFPRVMPRFNPSELYYEYGLPSPILSELSRRGHKLVRTDTLMKMEPKYMANVNAVCRTKQTGEILVNADYRKGGGDASSGF